MAAPASVIRALDLTVRRRVEGLLGGDHASTTLGIGTELAQVRPYQPGDDVRQIDWNVTARTAEPHVRVHVAERSLTTWLVLDTSPSMAFGTADHSKAAVAEGVAVALGHLACRAANRLGVVVFGGAAPVALPPTQGRAGLLGLLAALRDRPPSPDPVAGAESIGQALTRTGRLAPQRGLIVVVADFRGPGGIDEWRGPLLRLCARHDVLAVEIRDPREQELPDVGELWLVDPESGRQLRVDTRKRSLRERFAAAAAAERSEVATALAGCGADHLVLSTSGDWLRPLAGFLLRRQHRPRPLRGGR
ncbi:MAG: hypothetical protein QOG64_132 [Acidimicrobiaceae bacterium]|nr:hypothetical protein [Acidimicrobiaceae bacterium]